jgi:hypothetical protein
MQAANRDVIQKIEGGVVEIYPSGILASKFKRRKGYSSHWFGARERKQLAR